MYVHSEYLEASLGSVLYLHCIVKLKPHGEEADVHVEGGDLGALERPQGKVVGHGETGQGQAATHVLLVPRMDTETGSSAMKQEVA